MFYKIFLILLFILFVSIPCYAIEWFGRNDGGTTVQCLGTFNAPYPGSGTNQNCAYSGLQDLFDVVSLADIITLKAGDTWPTSGVSGFYRLKAKSGGTGTDADYIIVRTSLYASLPTGRVGILHSSLMPKIVARGPGGAIISTENNTRYWKFVGIEITNSSGGTVNEHAYTLIDLGQAGTTPNHLWFDHCYVHPQEDGTTNYFRTSTRGFGVNNVDVFKLTNSRVSGFLGRYAHNHTDLIDSEAISTAAAGTNYLIDNNYLGGYFNSIFFGGGSTSPTTNTGVIQSLPTPTITSCALSNVSNLSIGDYISFPQSIGRNAVGKITNIAGTTITYTTLDQWNESSETRATGNPPVIGSSARWGPNTNSPIDNIVITRNMFEQDTVYCQWEYDQTGGVRMPKGYFEIKWIDHGLIEGNVFTGWPSWININAVNQTGDSPWLTVRNLTIRNNWFKEHAIAVLNVTFGNPLGQAAWHITQQGSNITFDNNLCTNKIPFPVDLGSWAPRVMQQGWGAINFTVTHNTFFNRAYAIGDIPFETVATWGGSGPTTNFVNKDNILFQNQYGIFCSYAGSAFVDCWPAWTEDNNAVINASGNSDATEQAKFPNSYIVTNTANPVSWVGPLTNTDINNWKLATGSVYKAGGARQASDGTDVGANITNIINAVSAEDLSVAIPKCNWHANPRCSN